MDADKHHIKTRGSGGGDEDYNIVFLCRLHHIEIHQIGAKKMSEKHQAILLALIEKGWTFNSYNRLIR